MVSTQGYRQVYYSRNLATSHNGTVLALYESTGFQLGIELSKADFERVKERIAECWDEIQSVAAMVPAPHQITDTLRQAGAADDGQTLGLRADEIPLGMQYGHYSRNRFTVMKLSRVLNVPR